MSELQPGMLAMIVNTKNAGKIVELVSRAATGHRVNDHSMFVGTMDDGWFVIGDSLFVMRNGQEDIKNFSYVLSKHLMPIKPEADPLDVAHKEELHA